MYKVLVDANILVDFMFHREPFYSNSNKIISLCENKKIKVISPENALDLFER